MEENDEQRFSCSELSFKFSGYLIDTNFCFCIAITWKNNKNGIREQAQLSTTTQMVDVSLSRR